MNNSNSSAVKTIIQFVLLIVFVVILSLISTRIWGGKPEILPDFDQLKMEESMTVGQFGQANNLSNPMLKEIFSLASRSDLEKPLADYGTLAGVKAMVIKKAALAAEHGSKNWVKILIKFILWFGFLITVFVFFKNRKITSAARKAALALAVLIFGIVMGSDPSPMGTVKDAIHLFGATGAIFPPRMIALCVFLAIVFVANKYICAWGCQVGVLQDLIFHLNRTDKKTAVMGRQVKVPFTVSNGIRVAFLAMFTFFAFSWGMDIVEPIDPFKIYKPASLAAVGIAFLAVLLVASLFVYRPWCHFFCPFGLAGWLVEKAARVRINVDYTSCVACEKCATACPSTVMEAILKQEKKTIPDCFACYTCRDICPTASIRFSTDKRTAPPPGHFDGKDKGQSDRIQK